MDARGRLNAAQAPATSSGHSGRQVMPPGIYETTDANRLKTGQLVRLLIPAAPGFPSDTIVRIIGIRQQPISPTKRPTQEIVWQKTDYDSVYRFKKRIIATEVVTLSSWAIGTPPAHSQLALEKGGGPSPSQYPVGSMVYTRDAIQFFPPGVIPSRAANDPSSYVMVPRGTRCHITDHASAKAGPSGGRMAVDGVPGSTKRWHYALKAQQLTYGWGEEICSAMKEVGNFERLSREEENAYLAEQVPAPRVVHFDPVLPSMTLVN